MTGGFRIVCPDGNTRHFPYHNESDAEFDADLFNDRRCENALPGVDVGPCPQGAHTVEPALFQEPASA